MCLPLLNSRITQNPKNQYLFVSKGFNHAGHVVIKGIFTKEPSKSTSEAIPLICIVAAPGPKSDHAKGTMPKTQTKDWDKNNAKLKYYTNN